MKKDIDFIRSILKENKDGSITNTRALEVHFPLRFITKNLAYESQECTTVGMFCVICGQSYAIMNVMASVAMIPSATERFTLDGKDYVRWIFQEGSTFIKTKELIKNDRFIGDIFDEFISSGNVPYYYDYESYAKIMDTSVKYTGANIGANPTIMGVITSSIAKWPSDDRLLYRRGLHLYPNKVDKPLYHGYGSMDSRTNAISKLTGAFFKNGIRSAMLRPSARLERTDVVIRR